MWKEDAAHAGRQAQPFPPSAAHRRPTGRTENQWCQLSTHTHPGRREWCQMPEGPALQTMVCLGGPAPAKWLRSWPEGGPSFP